MSKVIYIVTGIILALLTVGVAYSVYSTAVDGTDDFFNESEENVYDDVPDDGFLSNKVGEKCQEKDLLKPQHCSQSV